MLKQKNAFWAAMAIMATAIMAFAPEKKYTLTLTEPEANTLLYVIDQSNAPHAQVKAVQEVVYKQLRDQVDTTGKKDGKP